MNFQVRSDQAVGQTGRIAAELLLDVCLQAQAMTPSCNMGTNKLSTKSTKLTGKTDSTSSLHLHKGRGDRVVSESPHKHVFPMVLRTSTNFIIFEIFEFLTAPEPQARFKKVQKE